MPVDGIHRSFGHEDTPHLRCERLTELHRPIGQKTSNYAPYDGLTAGLAAPSAECSGSQGTGVLSDTTATTRGAGASDLTALAEELAAKIRRLTEDVAVVKALMARLADLSREDSVTYALSRQSADEAGLGMMTTEVELRRLRSVLDGMAEPL